VLRVFFSRRWLGWHALLVAGIAVLILLGRWQWHRAQSSVGTLQNLGYAFEWWLFACLAVYGWWRELRADARAANGGTVADQRTETTPAPAATSIAGLARPAVPDDAAVEAADVDAELAAYNAYLTQLNARYLRQRH
jgi:DNA-binding transcriptional regulator of glucitol operon